MNWTSWGLPVALTSARWKARLTWKCLLDERPALSSSAIAARISAIGSASPSCGRDPRRARLDHEAGLVARAQLRRRWPSPPARRGSRTGRRGPRRRAAQRLADRGAGDAELLGEVLLVHPRAALDLTAGDALAQHLVDLIGDALDLKPAAAGESGGAMVIGYIIHMSEARVRIGAVADTRDASFGPWVGCEPERDLVALRRGPRQRRGRAVIFPVIEAYAAVPELALDLVDGLLLTGGRDLDAGLLRRRARPANDRSDPLRDRVELALARLAVERGLPVLAVCRGMHLLNVARSAAASISIWSTPTASTAASRARSPATRSRSSAAPGCESIIGAARGDRALASSPGGRAVGGGPAGAGAHAPDGLVEAAETTGGGWCVAVLWHPEEDLPGRRSAPLRLAGRRRRSQRTAGVAA